MSLRERYNVRNKGSLTRWIVSVAVCFIAAFFLFAPTLARFANEWNGRFGTQVAQWNIKVNGVSLSDTAAASSIPIDFYLDEATTPTSIVKPGQSGHFDIEIDSTGTETSFSYTVGISAASRLPNGMSIYYLNGETKVDFDAATGMTLSDDVKLPASGQFGESDIRTLRFYWKWDDVTFEEFDAYSIVVAVSAVQYFVEGGQTL